MNLIPLNPSDIASSFNAILFNASLAKYDAYIIAGATMNLGITTFQPAGDIFFKMNPGLKAISAVYYVVC
ncbi:MAG TPA: hypothetical protein VFS65_01260 [Candidatus Saccharimonadales bacterium]|nr:hypothetical protein [Candidatus Saccharimonadales bacterium]